MNIAMIREIEAAVYPEWMRSLEDAEDARDLADYCECSPKQLVVLQGDNWYLLGSVGKKKGEIADLACLGKLKLAEVFEIARRVEEVFEGRRVELDARVATSYPLILLLAKRRGWRVLADSPWTWEGEAMREMILQF